MRRKEVLVLIVSVGIGMFSCGDILPLSLPDGGGDVDTDTDADTGLDTRSDTEVCGTAECGAVMDNDGNNRHCGSW